MKSKKGYQSPRSKLLLLLLIFTILTLAVFMRFHRFSELFYFTHDEETMVYRMLGFIRHAKLFLIGGVTPLHVHTTPYFYYLSALVLAVGRLNPLIWGVFSGLVGVGTTILIFLLGRKMVGNYPSVLGSFLYAGSYLAALFDRHYWPLTFDPSLGILIFYGLFRIIQQKFWAVYLLAFALIFGFSSDWSNLLFFVITLVVWIIYRLPIRKKEVFFSFLLFLISLSPLVIFDIRHKGSNIVGINLFFAERGESLGWSLTRFRDTLLFIPQTLSRLLFVFGDQEVARQYTYCPTYSVERLQAVPAWFIAIVLLGVLTILWRLTKKISREERLFIQLLVIFLSTAFIAINIYGNIFSSTLHDHYLATLFGVAFLFYGYLLTLLLRISFGKIIVALMLGFFCLANLNGLYKAENVIGYNYKLAAVNFALEKVKGRDFALESLGSCYKWGGWRYLFTYLGHEPVKSYTDHNYFWLYEKPPARDHPDLVVVMVTAESNESEEFIREYHRFQAGTINRAMFGAIEVLVVDNRSHNYDGRF